MTSKEALNWLDAIINKPEVCGGNLEDNNNALNQIENDLQVLSIIKKYIDLDYLNNNLCSLSCRFNFNEDDEEWEIIKKWVENEK